MSNTSARFTGFCLLVFVHSLWAAPAVATVGRTQGFDIGAVNRVLWSGGIGSAEGQNQISFSQTHQASEHSRHGSLSLKQVERGTLTQTATATGFTPSTARQSATVKGGQDLLGQAGPHAAFRGRQDLEVKLDMRLHQPRGIGTVTGTQTYNGLQEQLVTTACATNSESQTVDVQQSGTISTQINVDPVVRNKITIGMHQSQVTTNGQGANW